MRLAHHLRAAAVACAVGLLVTGCAHEPSPEHEAPNTASTPSAAASTGTAPTGASLPAPPPAQASEVTLDWTLMDAWPRAERPIGAAPGYAISQSPDHKRVIVRDTHSRRVLFTYAAPDGLEVNQVFLDPPSLVVVTADPTDALDDRVTVIDLRTHGERGLAASAPATWMGSWSLGQNLLTYGARGPQGRYCLAAVALDSLEGGLVECVPPRRGVSRVNHSPFGLTYARFDDSRPMSCTTLRVRRGPQKPVDADGPARCRAWDAVAVENGLVWSEVPRPREIEVSEVFASTAEAGTQSLGYGTTGSLTWCGDYVWFVRQMGGGTIMRWSPDAGLEVTFQAAASRDGVLSTPLCSGTSIAFIEATAPGPGIREVLYTTRATD